MNPISPGRSIALALLVAIPIILIDQWTKAQVTTYLQYGDRVPITSFFNLVLVYNKGAAFSFLSNAGGWQRGFFIVLTLLVCVMMVWMLIKYRSETRFRWGLMFVLGGAIGNLIDRVLLGHVVDFLDFHWGGWHFWVFNVADSAITLGAGILIVDSFLPKKAAQSPA